MAVAEGDILQAVWQARVANVATAVQNVFHYRVSLLIDPADAIIQGELVADMVATFGIVAADLSSDYVAEFLRTVNLTRKEFVGDSKPIFAGAGAANSSTPAQIAVQVLARARVLGHTGRKYVGPVTEATHTDGELTAAALVRFTEFATIYSAKLIGGSGNEYTPVLVKFGVGGGVASTLDVDPDLFKVTQIARTMRSRIPGRGLT